MCLPVFKLDWVIQVFRFILVSKYSRFTSYLGTKEWILKLWWRMQLLTKSILKKVTLIIPFYSTLPSEISLIWRINFSIERNHMLSNLFHFINSMFISTLKIMMPEAILILTFTCMLLCFLHSCVYYMNVCPRS